MDIETVSAIERLGERIDALEASLHGVEDSLRGEISQLRGEVIQRDEQLRTEIRDGLAETRRHAVMLNESTREDIRFVAEAVAGLAVKIDSLHR